MPIGSKLDRAYRSILMTRFFTKGWGKPENLKRLFAFRKVISNRESCYRLVSSDHPISIVKEEVHSDCKILKGQFTSPFVDHLPGLLPKESETAYFQVILPKKWKSEYYKPVCLHLAGTGDHGFWRRRQTMAKPLLKTAGIAGILLENPFYGLRKPKDQVRSSLHNVTDIFVMGGCLILESLALFHWCERNGWGPLGISGISMGGHMASLAATSWPKPVVLVPCLCGSTASPVFTEGVMSASINWELLEHQYLSDEIYCDEIRKMVKIQEEKFDIQDAFRAGQHFAQNYPKSMERVNELEEQHQKEKMKQQVHQEQVQLQEQRKEQVFPQQQVQQQLVQSCTREQNVQHTHDVQQNIAQQGANQLNQEEQQHQEQEHGMVDIHMQMMTGEVLEVSERLDEKLNRLDYDAKSATAERSFVSAGFSPQSSAPPAAHLNTNEDKIHAAFEETKNSENREKSQKREEEKSSQSKRSKLAAKFMTKFSLLKHFNKSKSKLIGTAANAANQSEQKVTKQGNLAKRCEHEAYHFMRGIMDECTHLKNFDKPVDPKLVIAVVATEDAYVPNGAYTPLNELWPGAEIRTVNAGHVTAYVLHQHTFRKTIMECFDRMKEKYWNSNLIQN